MDIIPPRSRMKLVYVVAVCAAVIVFGFVLSQMRAPADFSSDIIVPIGNGMTLGTVAAQLQADHVIRSQFLFKVAVTLMRGKDHIGAGDYAFSKPENTLTVASRMIRSEQDLEPVRVTLPEGLTVGQMAPLLNAVLSTTSPSAFSAVSRFNQTQFSSLAEADEGYLFPDTYLFMPNDTAAAVISIMKKNFNARIAAIQPQIDAFLASSVRSGLRIDQNDVVIMASIVEKEATSTADRRIIAGILWKRLQNGQLLEADPTLVYANLLAGDTASAAANLTDEDLASSSPYNTYLHKGLPPTPIDNPGLDALTAVVTPTATDYWYYLSDSKGVTHYSVTYAQQLANEAKYIQTR